MAAALTADGKSLTLSVVNPTTAEVSLNFALEGAAAGTATRWTIAGPDEFAHNTPGQPRVIGIRQTDGIAPTALTVPALSCSLFVLPLK